MNKKELWHTRYKLYWIVIGIVLMLLTVPLAVSVSTWFTWLAVLGAAVLAYACSRDD